MHRNHASDAIFAGQMGLAACCFDSGPGHLGECGTLAGQDQTAKNDPESESPPRGCRLARGNSIQLFFDGKRWWVVTIFWDWSPDQPIPASRLPGTDRKASS